MTAIWTLLKNPKNILILMLAIAVLICGTVVLFQRGSLAKSKGKIELQSAEIENLKAVNKAYQKTVDAYADQVIKLQKLNESHQNISNQTAKVVTKIKYIKSDCKLEGNDALIINDFVDYFNTGKLRE
jgi:predicted Holliday junction resolvase-like endonuclease